MTKQPLDPEVEAIAKQVRALIAAQPPARAQFYVDVLTRASELLRTNPNTSKAELRAYFRQQQEEWTSKAH
jgi:hypothetical protein